MTVGARIDCDMHFFEEPDTWASYADPTERDRALRLEPDDMGYWWLTHQVQKREELLLAEFPVVAELLALAVTARVMSLRG